MMLARLAIHYYRPDFTEGQAKLLIADMVDDLSDYHPSDVETAIARYRRDPSNRFFPTSGQLRQCATEVLKERNETGVARTLPELRESRPICWWMLPRRMWKPHWSVDDIPAQDRTLYDRRLALGKVR